MADYHEKYFWLVWTIGYFVVSILLFSVHRLQLHYFLSGFLICSKCLVEDYIYLQEEDEKQNEKNH